MIQQIAYKLKRFWHFFSTGLAKGLLGEVIFRFPANKLTIITVTGTDGKTTSSTMLYHTLLEAGHRVGLISTVAARIDESEIDTGFHVTSPNPYLLHKLLRQMVDKGITHVVLETTSHGIYQFRTWGIKPTLAGVTNITHEHLDYHVTYQNYLEAKAEILAKADTAILNQDDDSYQPLRKILRQKKTKFSDYKEFNELAPKLRTAIKNRFPEAYNQTNARLVATIALALDVSSSDIISAMEQFPGVPGRMEVVTEKPIKVIVDFAHTPNGVASALESLAKQKPANKKLIAVYGSAGLRDFAKRPAMGRAGVDHADLVVFTAEDPRTENVWSIIQQMKSNLGDAHHKVVSIADRREAIEFAITKLAKKGDWIAILGKGHEQSMCYGTVEYPWDDRVASREIVDEL